MNNKPKIYNRHINNLNNYTNQIKKYYTKINSSKININKINNNKKKYSVNEHKNLLKTIQILNRNKSVKLLYELNRPFYMNKTEIQHKNKKEKIYTNKFKKINIPIDKKKYISNRKISKKIYTENNSQKNVKKNENNNFFFRTNKKQNDNDFINIYKKLNINKYNFLQNSQNLTKNNSFKNILKNKNIRIYDSERCNSRYFMYKTNKIKENKKQI